MSWFHGITDLGRHAAHASARAVGYRIGNAVASGASSLFRPQISNIHESGPWRYIHDAHTRRAARERGNDWWRFRPLSYYTEERQRLSYQSG